MSGGNKTARAVLLAAGQGKRMKSSKPKVLHEVLGKPILLRLLHALETLEIEHVHIVVGHEADQVRAFLEENNLKIPFSIHLQEPQRGTGDALRKVVPSLKGFEGTLLVSVADTPLLRSSTLKALLDGHRTGGSMVTMLTTVVEDPKNYGRIMRNTKGHVTAIIEHKDATPEQRKICEVNPAIYCFEWPAVEPGLNSLRNDNAQKEYYLTDLIGWGAGQGSPVQAVVAPDWREVAGINSRIELSEANRLLRDITVEHLLLEGVSILDPQSTWIGPEVKISADTTVLPGCYLMGDIEIGTGCIIGPYTVIQGPVQVGQGTSVVQSRVSSSVIGKGCKIGPFAHLRDANVIKDSVRIGNFVEIKSTSIGDQTNVSHLSYVGDAEIGSRANVGAGTITANYSHISKKKNRTIIGDDASTGSNSVLIAPITLGKGASLAAGSVANKDVPDGALAVARAKQTNIEGWANDQRRRHDKPPDSDH
jgi:bifunctional UDP-N-acetylglucosamine pyrophosphorylase/glucosamine-1-phosphate N-acetyltransferase